MTNIYSTIDGYIKDTPENIQSKLYELRTIIRNIAPEDTIETIAYAMPTFRWNGNLIHFAAAKNHIGIYPGPEAIIAHQEKLTNYKTTKGAIQIPLHAPLPKEIIEELVLFNIELLKNKSKPKWDSYRTNWTACDEFMQNLINKLNLIKEFKWGNNVYTYKSKNIVAWAGFKNFFSIWFYYGVFLEDKCNVLINASSGKTKALRQWRFTTIHDMKEELITAYILESIKAVDEEKELKNEIDTHKQEISIFLNNHLEQDIELKKAFAKLTRGKQKNYIEYINEAKQASTKQKRLEKIVPLILEGKGLYDKYQK